MLILGIAEADPTANRLVDTVAFALFGAGLGVFIAPSNHATLEAAPASLSGEAGSMLNLMRVLGTSLGVATASSTLAWRLEAVTGSHDSWIPFAGRPLLGAVESSLAVLVIMAVAAGAVSLIRAEPRCTVSGMGRQARRDFPRTTNGHAPARRLAS